MNTLNQKYSLLDFESTNMLVSQQRFLEGVASNLVEKFNTDRVGLLWELRNSLEKSFKDRVKGELMMDIQQDWEEKKREVEEMMILSGNTVGQLAEDLRRAKWKLENLALSHEKKVGYIMGKLE